MPGSRLAVAVDFVVEKGWGLPVGGMLGVFTGSCYVSRPQLLAPAIIHLDCTHATLQCCLGRSQI